MPVSGMAMMLKSFGIDPDEIRGNVEDFMTYMKAAADKINANQTIIEVKLTELQTQGTNLWEQNNTLRQHIDRIEKLIEQPGETIHIKENGLGTGVLVTTEKFPQEFYGKINTEVKAGAMLNGVPYSDVVKMEE